MPGPPAVLLVALHSEPDVRETARNEGKEARTVDPIWGVPPQPFGRNTRAQSCEGSANALADQAISGTCRCANATSNSATSSIVAPISLLAASRMRAVASRLSTSRSRFS